MERNLSENNNIRKRLTKIKAYLKHSHYPTHGEKNDHVIHVTILNEIDLAMKLLPL